MSNVKLSIIYYSQTTLSKWPNGQRSSGRLAPKSVSEVEELRIQQAPKTIPAGQSIWKILDVEVATSDDLIWADAVLFSAPTRFGDMAAQ